MPRSVPPTKDRKKVFVGLSGGVDSSVSAALLKDAGYEVTGVFIKVWQPPFFDCSAREDRLDAMRVAAKLNIPFLTLDLEKEYKKEVVDYMIREYSAGRTPNPDAMCNKAVKFGAFLDFALAEGAHYVATGHYARNEFNKKTGEYELREGTDTSKDQSYFLWTLGQRELAHVLFPVGGMKKEEVRKLARRYGLVTAGKKDSQGLCFVGKVDMKEFLGHYLPEKKGKVEDETGRVIGEHRGAAFYTLGERHGFNVTAKTAVSVPYYVVEKDMKRNVIVVSSAPEKKKVATEVKGVSAHYVGTLPRAGGRYAARFRYRAKPAPVSLTRADRQSFILRPSKPDYTVSPGQSVVLYDGDKCVGGAVIA